MDAGNAETGNIKAGNTMAGNTKAGNSESGNIKGESIEIELELLVQAIYLKYSYDFRNYAGASLKRRV